MSRYHATLGTTVAGLLIGAVAACGTVAAQTAAPVTTQAPAAKPAPRPAAPKAQPTPASAVPAAATVAPVTTGATSQPQAAAIFQTLEQLQKAGVKRCLQMAQAVGQAALVGSSQYAAASVWNNKQPDNRFSVSMIGQQFAPGQNSMPNALAGVFSVPTTEGKCDAAALQVIPTTDPCTTVQAQIMIKGRALGTLAGVPLLQNAANAQVMLLPGANNSCVLVALSTVYTE